ncbi:diacylglycerol kinase family lipid kinase [Clostridium sp. 19966]|uniref:diacylglycerol/lipid kinase family protein n=1 Tax=Clostridium sp. 19966 TaxID=2768166 RepID=UPI0028DDB7A2|nr:diacylglycerol kinase family lipid kinase [Clostridium sp. 19966]MDT8717410.1 diacylglycerol kinase family lipid kinase [Clostridium sp. 19966]
MKYLFIVNPKAGKGRGLQYIENIKHIIDNKIDYRIEVTNKSGHATEIARKYSHDEEYIICSVGGDGTLNEVVNGMAGGKSTLAIIPTGSGNDFVRTIYPKYILKDLFSKVICGDTKLVDLIKINEKYFLNIASVGLDADVAYNAIKFKKNKFISGSMAYMLSVFKTLLNKRGTWVKLNIDGTQYDYKKLLLIAISNGKSYGGGIHITPQAEVDDGFADICMIENLRLLRIFRMMPKLFRAQHLQVKEVKMYKAQEIEIEGRSEFKVNVDGEIVSASNIKIQVIPKALKIIIPKFDVL